MPKSLSEIRSSEHVGRPERTYPICVAGRLVAEMSALDRALEEAFEAESAKPRTMGEKSQAKKIAEQADALREQMAEHTVDVRLRASDNGSWRRWCQAHPAREDEERDKLFGVGICNSDDLIADLGTYVVKIGDDEPGKGDWDFIADNASAGDLLGMARVVMSMHESGVSVPKSRVSWLRERMSEPDSE